MAGNLGDSHRPTVMQAARPHRSMVWRALDQSGIGSGRSVSGRAACRSSAVRPRTGCRQPGHTSVSGCKTKRRRWARGCGRIGGGAARRRSPIAMRSRSRVRGAFGKGRARPMASSRVCNAARRPAGSASPPPSSRFKITTPLTNGGAPGRGGSGTVRYRRERVASLHPGSRARAAMAPRQIWSGPEPSAAVRFDPIATIAVFFRSRIIMVCLSCVGPTL